MAEDLRGVYSAFEFIASGLEQDVLEDEFSKTQGISIEEKLTESHITTIKSKFMESRDQVFSKETFQVILEDVCPSIVFQNPDEYNVLFKKMDYKRDNKIDWDEFISYIILEFQQKELFSSPATKQLLEPPIGNTLKVVRSNHRHPLVRLTYCPTVDNERQFNYHNGKYITASKDGCINYWSLDMVRERTVYSSCPELKVNATWVLDVVCMPDINVICTSSTERDLRFYDTTARKFELRVMISSLENAVCCMTYHFSSNIQEDSKLILGDMGGSVLILVFNSDNRGPFAQTPGVDVRHLRYESVLKGNLIGMRVITFLHIHSDWVSQVGYYSVLKSFISCSRTPESSMIMCDVSQTREPYKFNAPKWGIATFAYDEDIHMIATGGTDSLLRVWSPFVPSSANSTLKGHSTAICGIFIQKENNMLYSLSKDRCIKVWHYGTQSCIQTFTGISVAVGVHRSIPLKMFYNPETHTLMIAGAKIALLVCDKVVKDMYTDGYTHTKAVTKAMYNPLFKIVVTMGMDSTIMIWDLRLGKRILLIQNAHTQLQYGEVHEVEITTGTFDPNYTLLLTGARDGTLKMWNFNNGTCIRNMSIEKNCRVTNVMWIPNRILAVGWNRHVTEFADNVNVGDGKFWEKRHTEDILASCLLPPQGLVTSSYSGELIFWRLETGQPLKKFLVADPEKKHNIDYIKHKKKGKGSPVTSTSGLKTRKNSHNKHNTVSSKMLIKDNSSLTNDSIKFTSAIDITSSSSILNQALSSVNVGSEETIKSHVSDEIPVHSVLFLSERPMLPEWGSLIVSLETGVIQLWSHHKLGGIISHFTAKHNVESFVITMATDPDNIYLFTGDTDGYLRVWLMTNFGVPIDKHIEINVAELRKKFSYFRRVFKTGLNIQSYPILLSSYQGHTMSLTHIEYLSSMKIIISCSVDKTVRFWTLQGQYIGTLGSAHPWPQLIPDSPPELEEFRTPPDIKRIGSETTLKIVGYSPHIRHTSIDSGVSRTSRTDTAYDDESISFVHGKPVEEPILGEHFKLPNRGLRYPEKPTVDISVGPSIQVFSHMRTHELSEVKAIETPVVAALTKRIKNKKNHQSTDNIFDSNQLN